MNFLAHIFLSGEHEDLLLGNYMADFITNKQLRELPEDIQNGVFLHRKIDTFTDRHPEVKRCNHTIVAKHGKYTPVVMDIFFDYVLAQQWSKYTSQSYETFCQEKQRFLMNNLEKMPLKVQQRTSSMVNANFLSKYGEEAGIRDTYHRVSKRARYYNDWDAAFDDVMEHYDLIEVAFASFFMDMLHTVEEWVDRRLGRTITF